MFWVGLFIFVIIYLKSVKFRLFIHNPHKVIFYAVKDTYNYIAHKRWREFKSTGQLVAYTAYFGGGKTLSDVQYICAIYEKYNDLRIWCPDRKKWVTQKIQILSNVNLKDIPYEYFTGFKQIVTICKTKRDKDWANDTLTCTVVLMDEAGAELNCRNFKSNINTLVLNDLLTCRHHHLSLFYTTQKFKLVDALLRDVTHHCISCCKQWRFMVQEYFDSDSLEYATNPTMVEPYYRTGFFIRDIDFNRYDTLACVDNLIKAVEQGDILTDEEILALQRNNDVNIDGVTKPSKKWLRNKKKAR